MRARCILAALMTASLLAGCGTSEEVSVDGQGPEQEVLNTYTGATSPTLGLSVYVSDTYLEELGLTADEFFVDSRELGSLHRDAGYTCLNITAGYEHVDELSKFFISNPAIEFTIAEFDEFVVVKGQFTSGVTQEDAFVYLDIQFPNSVTDYSGDAIFGYSIAEGSSISLDIQPLIDGATFQVSGD